MAKANPSRNLLLNNKNGISLVELLIVLVLISVVLAVGYTFFAFGARAFNIGEARSIVQQNVRTSGDYIARQLRNAFEVQLLDASFSIPENIDDEFQYIFLNENGAIEHRYKDGSKILFGSDDVKVINLLFNNPSSGILEYSITAESTNPVQRYSISSELYIENLDLSNSRIKNINLAEGVAIRFISDPNAPPSMMAFPFMVPGKTNLPEYFTLVLTFAKFDAFLDVFDFELGDRFAGASILSVDRIDDYTANLYVDGYISEEFGEGTITVLSSGISLNDNITAKVILTTPAPSLSVSPSYVYEKNGFNETFNLSLSNDTFNGLSESHISLGGDFLGLSVSSIQQLSPETARLTLSGDLISSYSEGVGGGIGEITVDAAALAEGDSSLTATVEVRPSTKYTITLTQPANGTISIDPIKPEYSFGDIVTLIAIPDPGYQFSKWIVTPSSTVISGGPPYTLFVNGSKSITAEFIDEIIPVTGVTVTPASETLIVGEMKSLVATVLPENATNKNVTWSSSNNSVATVSAEGLVTGVSPGTATITATTEDGGHEDTCSITVLAAELYVTRQSGTQFKVTSNYGLPIIGTQEAIITNHSTWQRLGENLELRILSTNWDNNISLIRFTPSGSDNSLINLSGTRNGNVNPAVTLTVEIRDIGNHSVVRSFNIKAQGNGNGNVLNVTLP